MSYPNPMGRVRLLRPLRSETQLVIAGIGLAAPAGTFPFTMNGPGAVSVVLAGGELLGVKPGEFEWVVIDEPFTDEQRAAWKRHDQDPTPFERTPQRLKRARLVEMHGEIIEAAPAFVSLLAPEIIVDEHLIGIVSEEDAERWRDEVRTAMNALRAVLPPVDHSDNSDTTKQN